MGVFLSKFKKSGIEKLVEENDELKNTLHSVLQKHQSLVELDNKLAEARKEVSEILSKTDKHKSDLKKFDGEIQQKSQTLQELTDTVTSLTQQKNLLEETISSIQGASFDSQEAIRLSERKEKEISELNQRYHQLKSLFDKLTEEYNTTQQNLNRLHVDEEKLRTLIAQYGGNLVESLEKMKEVESDLNSRLAQLKAEENKRTADLKSINEKINLTEEIKLNLESSLSIIVNQLSEKEKLHSEFISKRESLLEEMRLKQKEYDEFEIRYIFEKETINKLETENKELASKRNQLYEEVSKFESVRTELDENILRLRNDEEKFTAELNQKRIFIDELEKRKIEIEENHLKVENDFSQVINKFTEEFNAAKEKLNSLRQDILEKEKELNSKERILLEKTGQVAEYSGLTKVLQKERAAVEQLIRNLKEEYSELNKEALVLKDDANRHKIYLQQLQSESTLLELKKDSFEKEMRNLINQTNENYSVLSEQKQKLAAEINENALMLNDLKNQVASSKEELRSLRTETANTETKKEEFASKISELIAMEKSLKFKIAQHEKKLDNANS